MYTLLTVISAVSFMGFGIGYLTVPRMRAEFTRYGLARVRILAAWLQVVGGAGQLGGLFLPPLAVAAAVGLAAMMGVAVGVRVRIGDPVVQTLPAVAYLLLDLYLLWASLGR